MDQRYRGWATRGEKSFSVLVRSNEVSYRIDGKGKELLGKCDQATHIEPQASNKSRPLARECFSRMMKRENPKCSVFWPLWAMLSKYGISSDDR